MEIIGKVDSGEKHLQMPGTIIKTQCPKCGLKTEMELIGQIYYPGDDREIREFGFECEDCEENWEIPYKVEVFAKITIEEK